MENVFSGEILNITPFKKGFVFATRSATPDGRLKASFFGYDAVNDKFTPIKKSIYLKIKFGYEYEEIAEQLFTDGLESLLPRLDDAGNPQKHEQYDEEKYDALMDALKGVLENF